MPEGNGLSLLQARIDADLLKKFRMALITKHGTIQGHMREEVEVAIQMWLAERRKR